MRTAAKKNFGRHAAGRYGARGDAAPSIVPCIQLWVEDVVGPFAGSLNLSSTAASPDATWSVHPLEKGHGVWWQVTRVWWWQHRRYESMAVQWTSGGCNIPLNTPSRQGWLLEQRVVILRRQRRQESFFPCPPRRSRGEKGGGLWAALSSHCTLLQGGGMA